jgi:hypothetical protein
VNSCNISWLKTFSSGSLPKLPAVACARLSGLSAREECASWVYARFWYTFQNNNLLNSRERELLANIFREVKNGGVAAGIEPTLSSILARGIGETLLQRASEAAGHGVLREIESRLAAVQDS